MRKSSLKPILPALLFLSLLAPGLSSAQQPQPAPTPTQAAPRETPATAPPVQTVRKVNARVIDEPQAQADAGEDFKGQPSPQRYQFGGLTGLGILDSKAAFAIIGTVAVKMVEAGFVEDINDPVFAELQLGPLFVQGSTAWHYSTHLRWDFIKDSAWTLYGLGGFGGNITGAALGDRWTLFPRFGAGAFWTPRLGLTFRGEISHELTAIGVAFAF